jgi:predicted adenine nucleotide alpha hydrolase (AANH) superfamily ATPase
MKKTMLLHTCCAPCASGVVPQLVDNFDLTLYYYNPNINSLEEYEKRLNTLKSYVNQFNSEFDTDIKLIYEPYDYSEFSQKIIGYEQEKEGGARCDICFAIRLNKTFEYAKTNGFDIVASTLSVSPHKDYLKINQIGQNISKKFQVEYMESNFKKKNGYLNSIKNSQKYNLYRQTYCGCLLGNE